jgi:hypothetical protein
MPWPEAPRTVRQSKACLADLPPGLRRGICGLVGAACWLGLPGCTTVTVHAGDGSVVVHRGFGFLNLQPAVGTTAMVVRGTSLGLQSGPWGHSLGYAKTSLTLLPAGCHVVVTVDDDAQASSPTLKALRDADPCGAPVPRPGGD